MNWGTHVPRLLLSGTTWPKQCRFLFGVSIAFTLVLLVWYSVSIPHLGTGLLGTSATLSCDEPRTHFAFLKVHKAGSSTVVNFLQRFVWTRHLNAALPNKRIHVMQYNYIGDSMSYGLSDVIPLPPGESYSALFNHVDGYNRSAFQEILPPDAFYFAIVREPLERFMSAITYYAVIWKGSGVFPKDHTKASLSTFFIQHWNDSALKSLANYKHFHNGMANDFGIPLADQDNVTAMAAHLHRLGEDFPFVMILEEFDLSLLLLRRRLCWSFKDILYQVHNARTDNDQVRLSLGVRAAFARWHRADMMIYDFFWDRFARMVSEAGVDLWRELRHFQEVLKIVADYCADNSTDRLLNGTLLAVESNPWSEAFTLAPEDCFLISLDELTFHDKMVRASLARLRTVDDNKPPS